MAAERTSIPLLLEQPVDGLVDARPAGPPFTYDPLRRLEVAPVRYWVRNCRRSLAGLWGVVGGDREQMGLGPTDLPVLDSQQSDRDAKAPRVGRVGERRSRPRAPRPGPDHVLASRTGRESPARASRRAAARSNCSSDGLAHRLSTARLEVARAPAKDGDRPIDLGAIARVVDRADARRAARVEVVVQAGLLGQSDALSDLERLGRAASGATGPPGRRVRAEQERCDPPDGDAGRPGYAGTAPRG